MLLQVALLMLPNRYELLSVISLPINVIFMCPHVTGLICFAFIRYVIEIAVEAAAVTNCLFCFSPLGFTEGACGCSS